MPTGQLPMTANADSNGNAVVILPPLPIGTRWVVTQVSVQVPTSVRKSVGQLLKNNQLVCQSQNANDDTAAGEPPVVVTSADQLKMVWSLCDPNAQCIATFYYELERTAESGAVR